MMKLMIKRIEPTVYAAAPSAPSIESQQVLLVEALLEKERRSRCGTGVERQMAQIGALLSRYALE